MPPPAYFRQLIFSLEMIFGLFLLMSFLTHQVASQAVVEYLPGFPEKLPFRLETGYIGLGESEEIFYYFVESESNPENDPLLIWLTGGPGCSGLSSLIYDFGPITFDYDNTYGDIPALQLNPYAFTKVASIIFVEHPPGCGYSYAKTPEAYKSNDTFLAVRSYEFLVKWLINHPKYLKNPLYVAGDSYSGITVPLVVNEVYNGIEAGKKPLLNMKGYILGNPGTNKNKDGNSRVDYAHRMGLLSDELYQTAKESCNGYYLSYDPDNGSCRDALRRVGLCVDKVYDQNILEPSCDTTEVEKGVLPNQETGPRFLQSVNPTPRPPGCLELDDVCANWTNAKVVQEALHVRQGTFKEWVRCNSSFLYNYNIHQTGAFEYNVKSVEDYHKKFTRKDCRALVYSGDHDMMVPHISTEEWIRSLNVPVQSDWRPWFVEGQVAGYTTAYSNGHYNLTYATVKGAGHVAPPYKRQECLAMVTRWLAGIPLDINVLKLKKATR